jgi:hypothetical protein
MTEAMATYLNDHNAGAHMALTLIERLADAHEAQREWLTWLRREIGADRETLRAVMRSLSIPESTMKQAAGWIGEKLTTLKLTIESPGSDFHRMEALETLSLGIQGKHKLWIALQDVAMDYPAFANFDFDRLQARALEQHAQVEHERLAAARVALRRESPQVMRRAVN